MRSDKVQVTLAVQMNHVEPFGIRIGRWFIGIVRVRPFQSAMDEFQERAGLLAHEAAEVSRVDLLEKEKTKLPGLLYQAHNDERVCACADCAAVRGRG